MINLNEYHVVTFHYIDDDRCFRPLCESMRYKRRNKKVDKLRDELAIIFIKHGWEGDGEIKCCFIPPIFLTEGDTHCEIIYHVKQSNNGTSFLLIPKRFEKDLHLSIPIA